MNKIIKDFYEGKRSVINVIEILGNQNVVFELQKEEDKKPKLYVICDKSTKERYDPNYKIHLLSTDLTNTQSFYLSDLEDILQHNEGYLIKVKLHYRGDLDLTGKPSSPFSLFKR